MPKTFFSKLPQSGLIRFSGEDAQTFLHGQLTCDVAALAPGGATYGAYCTPKGRMLASFLLWRSGPDFFMQLPSSLREPVQKQLSKFILRSRVKAVDATADWTLIGVMGKEAGVLARKGAGRIASAPHDAAQADGAVVIGLSAERCQIAVPSARTSDVIAALAGDAEATSPETWNRLAILAGIATVMPATQEAFVPQMVNLDLIGGVSLEKGCYPGQEIVARMHYRGTLKQRMYLAHVDGTGQPQPGDKVYSAAFGAQACGTIVNAAQSPDGGFDALAVVQTASRKDGVHWHSQDGPVLRFLPLPYAIPE